MHKKALSAVTLACAMVMPCATIGPPTGGLPSGGTHSRAGGARTSGVGWKSRKAAMVGGRAGTVGRRG